jgi:hypothetical protein
MLSQDHCRKKSADWMEKAASESDLKTAASMRRLSDAWSALAHQIEKSDVLGPRSSQNRWPRNLLKGTDSVEIGDLLRGRLSLGE